jgi:hypothetical protein
LAGRGVDRPQNATSGRRLSATALADESQSLTLVDVKIDVVDGSYVADLTLEEALLNGKVLAKVLDFEESLAVFRCILDHLSFSLIQKAAYLVIGLNAQ